MAITPATNVHQFLLGQAGAPAAPASTPSPGVGQTTPGLPISWKPNQTQVALDKPFATAPMQTMIQRTADGNFLTSELRANPFGAPKLFQGTGAAGDGKDANLTEAAAGTIVPGLNSPGSPALVGGGLYGGGGNYYAPGGGGGYSGSYGISGAGNDLLNSILGKINASDPRADVENSYQAQLKNALDELHLQAESAYANHGYAPGDPAARSLNARLYGKMAGQLQAAHAQGLLNADQQKIGQMTSLLPAYMQAQENGYRMQQAQQQAALDAQQRQQAEQEHQADLAYQQQVRQFQLDAMRKQQQGYAQATSQQQQYSPHAVYGPGPVESSYAGQTAPSAYRRATGQDSGGGGGYAPPINAPGQDGYNFWANFGNSFYAPTGLGGAQNALNAQTRRAEIAAAGNYSPHSPSMAQGPQMSAAMTDLVNQAARAQHPSQTMRPSASPSTYTPNGATAAPIAGGAQLAYAPPMSGIGYAGPLTSQLNPGAYGGAWNNGPSAYAIATGRA